MRYEVETESGSRYTIDTERKVFRREPRPEHFDDVNNSNRDVPYVTLVSLEVGVPLVAIWLDDGRPQLRVTTNVTSVREIASECTCARSVDSCWLHVGQAADRMRAKGSPTHPGVHPLESTCNEACWNKQDHP